MSFEEHVFQTTKATEANLFKSLIVTRAKLRLIH